MVSKFPQVSKDNHSNHSNYGNFDVVSLCNLNEPVMIMEQEIKLKDCFGTFDDKDPERGCSDCGANSQCESFKPKLAEHKTNASEQAINDYIDTSTQARQLSTSKFIAYTITIIILILVFWEVSKTF